MIRIGSIPANANPYLLVKLAAVARGRAASRVAEAGRMARGARAQVTR